MKKSNTGKSYVTLCTRASTCAVDLKLYCDFSSIGFQRALKEFIAKTSSATGKWLSTLKKDHNLASYIGRYKRQNIVISLFTTSGQQPQVNDVNWKQILALTLIVERER